MNATQKILIVGLDQAGKTSILNILQEKYTKMNNIKPTVGIERGQIEIFGFPIVWWDLGGQEKFRKDYLKNTKNFENTDSLFFIIDVLNEERYEEALLYFTNILEIFEKLETKPKLVVCIHKVDPNIRDNPETIQNIEKLRSLFSSAGYEISIFATSIYDRKTVIEAFSKTFQELISTLRPIKKLLETLVILLKIDAAVLFDENLMILNEYYQSKEIEEVCLNTIYNSIYYISHTNPKLAENVQGNLELVLNIKSYTKRFNFLNVTLKEWQVYLLTMGEVKLDPNDLLTKFNSMAHIFEKKKW